jgi:hypothetical protein
MCYIYSFIYSYVKNAATNPECISPNVRITTDEMEIVCK